VVAHLALRKGSSVTTAALRSWCRRRLASFQVPRRFIVHDELPRNAAGKVVKHALLDPGQG
jgi:acyl-CoA synthetase (AMP-forming)/AMP-acid ligase II